MINFWDRMKDYPKTFPSHLYFLNSNMYYQNGRTWIQCSHDLQNLYMTHSRLFYCMSNRDNILMELVSLSLFRYLHFHQNLWLIFHLKLYSFSCCLNIWSCSCLGDFLLHNLPLLLLFLIFLGTHFSTNMNSFQAIL